MFETGSDLFQGVERLAAWNKDHSGSKQRTTVKQSTRKKHGIAGLGYDDCPIVGSSAIFLSILRVRIPRRQTKTALQYVAKAEKEAKKTNWEEKQIGE